MPRLRGRALIALGAGAVVTTSGLAIGLAGGPQKDSGAFRAGQQEAPRQDASPQAASGAPVSPPPKAQAPTAAPGPAGRACTVNQIMVPSCGAYWGVHTARGRTLTTSVLDLERRTGRRFDIAMFYNDFSGRLGPGQFPDANARQLGKTRRLLISWDTRDYRTRYELKWRDIAAGRYDASVVAPAARRVRAYGKKIFISFDHEMEMHSGNNGHRKGTEAEYVAAARHVRHVFDRAGVKNVVWVWTTTGYLGEGWDSRIKRLYPGHKYVDWVAWDSYNYFKCQRTRWLTFDQKMSGTYRWMKRNIAAGKPFMLPEYGTQYDPGNPARSRQWYLDIPRTLAKKYPSIKALIRWDSDWGCGIQIDSGPGMLNAFAAAGRHPYLNPGRR